MQILADLVCQIHPVTITSSRLSGSVCACTTSYRTDILMHMLHNWHIYAHTSPKYKFQNVGFIWHVCPI